MGDVIDFEEYRKRRIRDAAAAREEKPGRGRRRERKPPLAEPAEPAQESTDDESQD
jgi:hypothetical protein